MTPASNKSIKQRVEPEEQVLKASRASSRKTEKIKF